MEIVEVVFCSKHATKHLIALYKMVHISDTIVSAGCAGTAFLDWTLIQSVHSLLKCQKAIISVDSSITGNAGGQDAVKKVNSILDAV